MKYQSKSETQTFNLGKKLAKALKGGEVLALNGELGAGKTILVKGIAHGLGIKKIITSPTFVLMKVYPVRGKASNGVHPLKNKIKKLIHIDCYRINNPQEIIDIGAVEYFGQPGTVVVIEWADKIKKIIPAREKINIDIRLKGKTTREITIK